MTQIGQLAYAILDGTLIPIDRLSGSADRRYFSGKHRRHGVNAQVTADPHGRLMWVSPALPGSVHDLKAARTHGIYCRGARGAIGVPFYGRRLPTRMREVNAAHAKARAIGERAFATLKTWKILAKLHGCPQRATASCRRSLPSNSSRSSAPQDEIGSMTSPGLRRILCRGGSHRPRDRLVLVTSGEAAEDGLIHRSRA